MFYYIDTDEILGFFLLLKNNIFIARSKDTFLSFTCKDIGVIMVTEMISQYQVSKVNEKSCVLPGNFISICKINKTLHDRFGIRILSSPADCIHSFATLTHERY